jgi:hypothetical protein
VIGKVKKGLAAAVISLTLLIGGGMSVSAAEVPCVATCARDMGGQHVAGCAQTTAKGVSTCALER